MTHGTVEEVINHGTIVEVVLSAPAPNPYNRERPRPRFVRKSVYLDHRCYAGLHEGEGGDIIGRDIEVETNDEGNQTVRFI